jgi:hypothetical protein
MQIEDWQIRRIELISTIAGHLMANLVERETYEREGQIVGRPDAIARAVFVARGIVAQVEEAEGQ